MQLTTISFFQLEGLAARFWALSQMQLGHRYLSGIKGLTFYKLMGSGRAEGFDWRPEWGRYALLMVWESEEYAERYFQENAYYREYSSRAAATYTLYMRCHSAHGSWSGSTVFELDDRPWKGPVAVITRATIRWNKVAGFWREVAPVADSLDDFPGKRMAVGIGEWPLIQQATFSLWADEQSMKDYAYKHPAHREVIRKTRQLGWYSEELFARFTPFRSVGSWYDTDPLSEILL